MINNILTKRPLGLIAQPFMLPKLAFWPQKSNQKE